MLRILIAEDEDVIRRGLVCTTDWLSMDCVVVAEASDGQEGLEKILESRPDVVIADICMPCLDGIEMIRQAEGTLRFKSILLTSYEDFEFAKRAIEAKVSAYLLRPVDEEELARVIVQIQKEIDLERRAERALRKTEEESVETATKNVRVMENGYVAECIRRIQKDYQKRLSVEQIAMELGVSASYLSRKFKEATGQTFLDFLNRYRVQQATALLETGRYRISEISEATGFSDYKHFCAVFKKYTSKSPTKFQQEY